MCLLLENIAMQSIIKKYRRLLKQKQQPQNIIKNAIKPPR